MNARITHGGHGALPVITNSSDETSRARRSAVGQLPDALHHGRHEVHAIDAVLLDQRQTLRRVEAPHEHDGRAAEEPLPRRAERHRVVERTGHEHRARAP